MARPLRVWLLVILSAVAAAAFVAACGGQDESAAGEPVDTLLQQTFTGDKKIDSGRLSVDLSVEPQGGNGQLRGPVRLSLDGPFSSNGKDRLPSFALDAKFSGAGQDIAGGVTSTGDKGFVSFLGQPYAIADRDFARFKGAFERAQRKEHSTGGVQSLATLGIDPRDWLTNGRNEGEADVGGTKTIKITGGVDVDRLLDDVDRALRRAASLGGQAGRGLPNKLTAAQKREIRDAVRRLDVEIYTGQDDKILRRLVVDTDLHGSMGAGQPATTARVRLDVSLTDLNEDQTIETPTGARPLSELLSQLGGLGFGLGGSSARGSGGASSQALEDYAACIRKAGSDAAQAQQCARLLTP